MAAGGILVRALPRRQLHRELASAAALVLALELACSVLVVHWQNQTVRVVGAVVFIGAIAWFALGTRTALLALALTWGVLHAYLSATDLGGSAGGFNLNLSRALGAAIVVGVGLALLSLSVRGIRLPVPLRAVALFGALFVFEALIAPDRANAEADLVRVANGVLVGIAAFRVFDTRERLLKLAAVAYFGGLIVAGMTILQYALTKLAPGISDALFGAHATVQSYDPNAPRGVTRVLGPLGGPGETAGFLVVAAFFGLLRYAVLRESRKARTVPLGMALISAGVLATLTRSSFVALVLLVVLWLAQLQLRHVSAVAMRTKVLAGAAAVLVLAVPLIGMQNLQARLWDINPATSGSSFAQGRAAIWKKEMKIISSSSVPAIVFGHGAHTSYLNGRASAFRTSTYQYSNREHTTELSPHNLIPWLVIETGLVGTILYVLFLIGTGVIYRRTTREHRFTYSGQVAAVGFAALIAYQVQGMFTLSPNNPGHGLYFMLFAGATLRACVSDGSSSETEAEGGT